MAKGHPKDWTLDELRLIWTFDGSDGTTVTEQSRRLGVRTNTWYSIKARLRNAGGPEQLHEQMLAARTRRYNRAADRQTRPYVFKGRAAGRDGGTPQYTLTIPPALAAPFIAKYGETVLYEAREDGILIKPCFVEIGERPSWLADPNGDRPGDTIDVSTGTTEGAA